MNVSKENAPKLGALPATGIPPLVCRGDTDPAVGGDEASEEADFLVSSGGGAPAFTVGWKS
jgi:hypothetical protein